MPSCFDSFIRGVFLGLIFSDAKSIELKKVINNINISGPINIVRLEGEIDKEKKVLYLFFDIHVRDTKCKEYDSLNVVQLFNKFIDESKNYKNEWDLFIESDVNTKNIKDINFDLKVKNFTLSLK